MRHTYIIPEWNLPKLQDEVAKLNKRAGKLKAQPITVDMAPAYQELEWKDPRDSSTKTKWFADHHITHDLEFRKVVGEPKAFEAGEFAQLTGRIRNWVYVTVIGSTPKYDGWSLVGVLEPLTLEDGTTENVVRCVPGHSVPVVYRDRVGKCDHCKTIRKRNETFVVQHEDGRTRMVGRQCLKDFLGHADPHALARLAELLFDLSSLCDSAGNEDWLGGSGCVPNSWTLLHFLTVTSAVIRKEGWMSRGKARESAEVGNYKTATADYVQAFLSPPKSPTKEEQQWRRDVEDMLQDPEHEVEAQQALDWCKDLSPTEGEDYLYNINLVARAGYVKDKTAGLAASILPAYRRAMGLNEEKKERPVSQHLGKVGDKLELDVECTKVIATDGMYGTTGIHKMFDDAGNSLTWLASGGTTWLDEGCRFRIKGTVKAHDEYKGQKQTILTRVKIVRDYSEQEAAK